MKKYIQIKVEKASMDAQLTFLKEVIKITMMSSKFKREKSLSLSMKKLMIGRSGQFNKSSKRRKMKLPISQRDTCSPKFTSKRTSFFPVGCIDLLGESLKNQLK
jgi:hypothetical protein